MSKHLSIEDIRVGCEGLNLVDEALGAKVLYSSDEWFASADNLIKPGRGEFDPDAFTLNGKLMDGWETSRHAALNRGGSDFCIIQMGVPGRIESVDIDTNHFTGNFAEFASLEACCYPSDLAIHANHPTPWFQLLDSSVVQWEEILPKSKLVGGGPGMGHNIFSMKCDKIFTHVKLTMYPDGGIARLKVYGKVPAPKLSTLSAIYSSEHLFDIAGLVFGGKAIACSNKFYSSPWNLLRPWKALNMGDGWETRRSRDPENIDWVVVKLGVPCTKISAIEMETTHFKGNFPHLFRIEGIDLSGVEGPLASEHILNKCLMMDSSEWKVIVPLRPGKPHAKMVFHNDDLSISEGKFTHVRIIVIPDGGVSRLRVYATHKDLIQ